ncbi:M1 family metallopeptidase [Parahaliea mediterranea]|uniref:Aminopeptidase n=1 Tax=Parahaliea mediterranea TaxID=651086 RepID=A0A939IM98_9GAMM|nr:M1 family metallopeptidase [Parahaliea mediterranea]MBN7796787.1 M1 family metallopeptidase [Parahaliea mediterranea]
MKPSRLLSRALLSLCCIALLQACGREPSPASQAEPGRAAAPLADAAPYPAKPPSARLPEGVTPRHYALELSIDPRRERFQGTVRIDVSLGEVDYLWMHGNGLEVTAARALLADGESLELRWEQALPTGTARVSGLESAGATEATLEFEYSAPFNTNLEGLYKVASGGESYAFTQFEATSARLAFPSFDEPAFKVPFDIQLTVPAGHSAITNTPETSVTDNGDGTKTITYATTKPLPTYLIAFAVGPFDVVEWDAIPAGDYRDAPLPLRGITTRGKGEQIHFALDNTAAIVEEMERYFDTAYPYAKLDIIAVPDFSAGAMENAGAITYREQLILLDESAPVSQKRGFFVTHAHELAHHWFGNLVTPVWWDDIWLNESFATWNAYIILDRLYPNEHYRESLLSSASNVMTNDSLASARQIREPITRHEDIGSAFNGITYQKGGGVLSMFEAFLGQDNFRDGIRHYMKAFAFGNTTAHDFIGAIAAANPQVDSQDLQAAFRSFIEQPGLPVLKTALSCTDQGPQLDISQQRYLPAGSAGSTAQQWIVPACVSAMTDGETQSQCFLLKEASEKVALVGERCPDAVLPNTGGASYYRWSLPPEQWQALLERFDELDTNEQISVANSLSAALNDGSLSLADYLDAVAPVTRSSSWRVAIAPRADLYKLKNHVLDGADREALQARMRDWYRPVLAELEALPEPSPDQRQFRMLMMSTLALGAADEEVHARLAADGAALTGFGDDGELHLDAIDPNLRYIALLAGIEAHGKPFADLLWRHFLASDNALLREYLLGAMAWSTDPEVAAAMRGRILSPELRDNEIFDIFSSQMAHAETRDAVFAWTADNLEAVLGRVDSWRKGQLPSNFDDFCSEEDAAKVEATFAPIIDSLESGPRYLANTLETIRLCAAFATLHGR